MNLQEAQALLKRISYKPGWSIELSGPRADVFSMDYRPYAHFHLRWHAECSVTGKPDIQINSSEIVHLDMLHTVDDLVRCAFRAFQRCEDHELREWFKVDGVPPFDPHRGEVR